mmetsp:Transcript_26591/g.71334  ORF Transcript_26591/g.71334 Transcript_26591/m.71334 type:complete len:256 (+) Transcript_26591:1760-2527(+)
MARLELGPDGQRPDGHVRGRRRRLLRTSLRGVLRIVGVVIVTVLVVVAILVLLLFPPLGLRRPLADARAVRGPRKTVRHLGHVGPLYRRRGHDIVEVDGRRQVVGVVALEVARLVGHHGLVRRVDNAGGCLLDHLLRAGQHLVGLLLRLEPLQLRGAEVLLLVLHPLLFRLEPRPPARLDVLVQRMVLAKGGKAAGLLGEFLTVRDVACRRRVLPSLPHVQHVAVEGGQRVGLQPLVQQPTDIVTAGGTPAEGLE